MNFVIKQEQTKRHLVMKMLFKEEYEVRWIPDPKYPNDITKMTPSDPVGVTYEIKRLLPFYIQIFKKRGYKIDAQKRMFYKFESDCCRTETEQRMLSKKLDKETKFRFFCLNCNQQADLYSSFIHFERRV